MAKLKNPDLSFEADKLVFSFAYLSGARYSFLFKRLVLIFLRDRGLFLAEQSLGSSSISLKLLIFQGPLTP